MRKDIIARNFSKEARHYDRYSSIQDRCAAELASRNRGKDFSDILDIGCGTGNYTKILKDDFSNARITAVDISNEMVRFACGKLGDKGIEFVVKDAEEPGFKRKFDLVSSNAAFQWFEDLGKTLRIYRELLKEGGVITFSIFGPLTYYELDRALKDVDGPSASVASGVFATEYTLKRAMSGYFKDINIDEIIYTEEYGSLKELLRKIKHTGTRGYGGPDGKVWTRDKLEKVERAYIRNFSKIKATYQVFFCGGAK
jgi:malonyl-ACP O-methyltransferase BioC